MKGKWLAAALLVMAPVAVAQSLTGLWDATINVNGNEIPFRIEFSAEGQNVMGWFFNGDEKVTSTRGKLEKDSLVLYFDHYATRLEATWKDDVLEGQYGPMQKKFHPFKAKRFVPAPPSSVQVPSIAGLWEIGVKSAKGESAWRLIVRQSGPEVSAAILRVDGDTGTLTGSYQASKFVLSHFSGARPLLAELTPASDGTLAVALTDSRGKTERTARRPAVARAEGLPEPTDPARHTTVKDPSEPFQFSFPDLNGRIVSNTDPRFQGKVVLVSISGSWCPNCHDEAPFLVELYRKHHREGLEIVALSFEEGEQGKNPTRLRAFIKQYGIPYTVLLGGEPAEVSAKLPQTVNLDCWPTTFVLGRDGRVRAIHAGFPGRASGDLHRQAVAELYTQVAGLLAETQTPAR